MNEKEKNNIINEFSKKLNSGVDTDNGYVAIFSNAVWGLHNIGEQPCLYHTKVETLSDAVDIIVAIDVEQDRSVWERWVEGYKNSSNYNSDSIYLYLKASYA